MGVWVELTDGGWPSGSPGPTGGGRCRPGSCCRPGECWGRGYCRDRPRSRPVPPGNCPAWAGPAYYERDATESGKTASCGWSTAPDRCWRSTCAASLPRRDRGLGPGEPQQRHQQRDRADLPPPRVAATNLLIGNTLVPRRLAFLGLEHAQASKPRMRPPVGHCGALPMRASPSTLQCIGGIRSDPRRAPDQLSAWRSKPSGNAGARSRALTGRYRIV